VGTKAWNIVESSNGEFEREGDALVQRLLFVREVPNVHRRNLTRLGVRGKRSTICLNPLTEGTELPVLFNTEKDSTSSVAVRTRCKRVLAPVQSSRLLANLFFYGL
jgi:hypothetical protein